MPFFCFPGEILWFFISKAFHTPKAIQDASQFLPVGAIHFFMSVRGRISNLCGFVAQKAEPKGNNSVFTKKYVYGIIV